MKIWWLRVRETRKLFSACNPLRKDHNIFMKEASKWSVVIFNIAVKSQHNIECFRSCWQIKVHLMNTKKVEKLSEYEQRLLSLKIQVTFRRIKTINVTIIPFWRNKISWSSYKVLCEKCNYKKDVKAYFVKKCILDKIKFVDHLNIDMLEVCGIFINRILQFVLSSNWWKINDFGLTKMSR